MFVRRLNKYQQQIYSHTGHSEMRWELAVKWGVKGRIKDRWTVLLCRECGRAAQHTEKNIMLGPKPKRYEEENLKIFQIKWNSWEEIIISERRQLEASRWTGSTAWWESRDLLNIQREISVVTWDISNWEELFIDFFEACVLSRLGWHGLRLITAQPASKGAFSKISWL